MLQLGPRGEHGVEVFLVPLCRLHEVGHPLAALLVGEHLQRLQPLVAGGLAPVDLAHALLHLLQGCVEAFPLGLLLHQDLLGGSYTHGGEDVEALWHGTEGGLAVIVDRLLQHLAVGLVALGHDADLVVAGLLELRADAGLLVADFVEGGLDAGDGLAVVEQF